MIAELLPVDGSPAIAIRRDITLVGRKQGMCDVILDDSSVSKMHCALAKTDGLLFLRDLGSTNGTRVNGQKVIRGALLPGDELAVANVKFTIHLGPGEPADSGHLLPAPEQEEEQLSSPESCSTLPEPPDESSDDAPHRCSDRKTIESDNDISALPV